jgi:hypothetical protein
VRSHEPGIHVLAVPARELDTLRTLAKWVRMGLVQLTMPMG